MNNAHIGRIGLNPALINNILPDAPQKTGQFRDILSKSLASQSGVKFSAHALERLNSRNISLSGNDISRLNSAVNKAEQKGSRDSLILMNNMAFVVSVENKTVITAMTNNQMRDSVITNIDSTVVL